MADDDLDLDVEETSPADSSTPLDADKWQKEVEKLRKENHSLRVRFRRTEMEKEYGADVLELVPDDLSLEKQGELAAKLAERFRNASPTQTEAPTEAEAEAPPQAEVVSEAERNLAAVTQGSVSPGGSAGMDEDEIRKLAFADPARYAALRASGSIPPPSRIGADKNR